MNSEYNLHLEVDIRKKLKDFSLDISFEAGRGCLGILGPSGCGKSMTLKSIAGIIRPDQGRIALRYAQGEAAGGRVLYDSALKINEKPQVRRVGYLFQNYALFPGMTVEQNIMVGLKGGRGNAGLRRRRPMSGEARQQKVSEMVERFRLLVERLGGSDDPVSFNRDYLTYLGEGNQLLPGAEDLCRDLRAAGCRLALATNGVARVQHARLDASPLKPYFSAVIISQEVGAQKPQPAFFQAALEALGVLDKARCVMVGDTLGSDIQGGIAAGLDTIWYDPQGRSPGDLRPTYIAASFQEVRQYIIEE